MSCFFKTLYPLFLVILLNFVWPSQAQQDGITVTVGSQQYYIETESALNFFKASHACAKLAMKLATFKSENDSNRNRIKSVLILNDISDKIYWLSGTTKGSDSTAPVFTDFLTGEKIKLPSTLMPAADQCLSTAASSFDYKIDVACMVPNYFICEKPILPYCGKRGQCRYRSY